MLPLSRNCQEFYNFVFEYEVNNKDKKGIKRKAGLGRILGLYKDGHKEITLKIKIKKSPVPVKVTRLFGRG